MNIFKKLSEIFIFEYKRVLRIFILFIISGIFLTLFGIFLLMRFSEDTWLCQNGQWIKHGFPDGPKPSQPCGENIFDNPKKDLINVNLPKAYGRISSPINISGQARGYWFFEASFPVEIHDAEGKILGQGIAQANPPAGGDWMTEDFVPFSLSLEFLEPETENGFIIFKKDNPSGLPDKDDFLSWPVFFN